MVAPPRPGNATRWFGYDIFLSFALGAPPRGTHSYASDLARRLRERDLTVFFSEDEAAPGDVLDAALVGALRRSRTLVVVANRPTLADPRWVRTEVETFRSHHPNRSIVVISVDGALDDPAAAPMAHEWLTSRDKIWLNESREAVETGIASDVLVERLALAPRRFRSNVVWRRLVRGVIVGLLVLIVALGGALWLAEINRRTAEENAEKERLATARAQTEAENARLATKRAQTEAENARRAEGEVRNEFRTSTALRLSGEGAAMLLGFRVGSDERALLQVIAAARLAPRAETEAAALDALLQLNRLRKLIATPGEITAMAVTRDGRRAVSGMNDGTLRWWDTTSGNPIGPPLARHRARINSLAIGVGGQWLVSASDDTTIRRWNSRTGAPMGAPLTGHTRSVAAVALSPNDQLIASGGTDGTLRLWDTASGRQIHATLLPGDSVSSVAFSPHGERLLSGTSSGLLQLWNAADLTPIGKAVVGHKDPVTSVAFSPGGNRVASGSFALNASVGDTLRLWDARLRDVAPGGLRGHKGAVTSVSFVSAGRLVSTGEDGTIRLWDDTAGQAVDLPLQAHEAPVVTVVVNQASARTVSASADGTIRVWDNASEPIGRVVYAHVLPVWGLVFSADGRRLVSSGGESLGSPDNTLRVWDPSTGLAIGRPLTGHTGTVASVAFGADSSRVVSGSYDGTLRWWDLNAGRQVGRALIGHKEGVNSVAYSARGTSSHPAAAMTPCGYGTRRPVSRSAPR